MRTHRTIVIVGAALFLVPLSLLMINRYLISCVEYPEHLKLLGVYDRLITSYGGILIILILLGIFTMTCAYYLKTRTLKHSWIAFLGKVVLTFLLILFVLSFFLASLNAARNKGPEAATLSTVTHMRAQAEIYYDNNNYSYSGLCASEEILLMISQVESFLPKKQGVFCPFEKREIVCNDSELDFVVYAKLYAYEEYFCVDGTRKSEMLEVPPEGMSCK